jgi:hypothetical protein
LAALLAGAAVLGILVVVAIGAALRGGGKSGDAPKAADSNRTDGATRTDQTKPKDGTDRKEAPPTLDPSGPVGVAIPAPRLKAARTEVALAEPFDQVRTGGGGRYLIFHLPKARKLAIFDVAEVKVVKELEAPDDVLFAAGLDALVVVLPGQKLLYRWSFDTFDRSRAVPLPYDRPVRLAAMGAGSRGPLLLWNGGAVSLWDVQKLEPRTVRSELLAGDASTAFQVRAAADGRSFVGWSAGVSPQAWVQMRLEGDRAELNAGAIEARYNGAWALPAADGRLTFHNAGVCDADLKPLPAGAQAPSCCRRRTRASSSPSAPSPATSTRLRSAPPPTSAPSGR